MRSHSRFSIFASMLLLASITSIVAPSSAQAVEIPAAESNLFILDVSGSTDSVALWKNLRTSVTSKLNQPFGNPIARSIPKKVPIDVSITSVSKNSQNSPIFSIVTKTDAKKMWGTVEQVFPKSTDARLERITDELFGESGAWASQARIFARSTVTVPTSAACRSSAINSINKGQFLRSADVRNKSVLAAAICEGIINIAKNLKRADDYFSVPVCDPRAVCSDVAGAILRATNLAADVARQKKDRVNGREVKNRLCIAIASDMLNESPGVSKTSDLNSKHVALTAASQDKAKEKGFAAARAVGIKFPSDITTRAVMVGIGSGPNPLPLDRNSYLMAYWEGFWTEAGVGKTKQAQSIDQACAE
jgi:hypothetical protein